MAEETLADRLMARIQKQTIINGIKQAFKKFPQARILLPFLKDALGGAKTETDAFLGNADNVIVIGRKNGVTNIVIINGKKEFTISKGLNITQDKTDPAVTTIKSLDAYYNEIFDSGIFDLITEEDNKKFLEMKENGGLESVFETQHLNKIFQQTPSLPSGQDEIVEETPQTEIGPGSSASTQSSDAASSEQQIT